MTPEQRLKILELTRPNVTNPDVSVWLSKARELEAYVSGAGQPEKSVQQEAATQDAPKARTPRK